MDFSNYKFRPSCLGRLMINARGSGITDKQLELLNQLANKEKRTEKQQELLDSLIEKRDAPPELSETTKAFLKEIYIEEVFNRKKDITSKYTEKGTLVEEDSISLASSVLDVMLLKNEEKYSNDYIQGTPDIIFDSQVWDIKSSWDIWTFGNADGSNKDYYWQLRAYTWLLGVNKAKLVYCLVNSPEHLIADEVRVQAYRNGLIGKEETEEFYKMEDDIRFLMTFDDIDPKLRIKTFDFEFKDSDIEKIIDQITIARQYLSELSL